jgi:cephalosporin hydroxylase
VHPLAKRATEFGALQEPAELSQLLRLLEQHELRTVIEIGTYSGGTLYCWCRLAEPDALIVSIDLPGGVFGGGCTPERVEEMKLWFPQERQQLHLLPKDSHERSTLEEVESLLGETKVDFLFIDGDHTYEGVKQDFELYSPLVKTGGLIAFHDIVEAPEYPASRVWALWAELKGAYRHAEFTIERTIGGAGIGVLWQG